MTIAHSKCSEPLIYLTVNDGPSGVYTGQVIDVVHLLRERTNVTARLVALVPLVLFHKHLKSIKLQMADAIVLPMFPKLRTWRFNFAQLAFVFGILGRCSVIARNPLAGNLALDCRNLGLVKRVCYDGRGAVAAELAEYSPGNPLRRSMPALERRAVLESDFQIAVSSKLVEHWHQEYCYTSDKHVVIPCSYSGHFARLDLAAARNRRHDLGLLEQDIVLVFAGATSGWQSAELLVGTASAFLAKSSLHKLISLSEDPAVARLLEQFPNQVRHFWLEPKDVPKTMAAGDYGLLIREPTITNKVSAPAKFAEYLACGLPVICSDCVGDYPEFLRLHQAGLVLNGKPEKQMAVSRVTMADKVRIRALAETWYSKRSAGIEAGYLRAAEAIGLG